MGKQSLILVLMMLCFTAVPAFSSSDGVTPSTMEKYQKAKQQVEALATSSAVKFAPEVIKLAGESVSAAQNGLKAGSDKETREAAEMALLQVKFAGALSEERAATEKTAMATKELAAFEQRLLNILSGKGDRP